VDHHSLASNLSEVSPNHSEVPRFFLKFPPIKLKSLPIKSELPLVVLKPPSEVPLTFLRSPKQLTFHPIKSEVPLNISEVLISVSEVPLLVSNGVSKKSLLFKLELLKSPP
jgi:hypothetical protein